MPVKLCNVPDHVRQMSLSHGFYDDFQGFVTLSSVPEYTVVTAVDGTVLIGDSKGGQITIASATATVGDNEDCYLAREPEAFLIADQQPIEFEISAKYSEVSTNTPNIIFGLTDGVAANLLVNDGAGPKTGGDFFAFYKKDGSLNWWIGYNVNGGTQVAVELLTTTTLTKQTYVGASTTFKRFNIEIIPKNTTQCDVIFSIDGVAVYNATDVVYTSCTDMQAVAGCKNGTTTACSLVVDYWWCYQNRV